MGLQVLIFLGSLVVVLGASELLGRGLDRLGSRLGLSDEVVGMLTALGADSPEIASAVVALLSGQRAHTVLSKEQFYKDGDVRWFGPAGESPQWSNAASKSFACLIREDEECAVLHEFRRTQRGNNNAYCQDNEVSWFDWSSLQRHEEIYQFARGMIAFRRVLHTPVKSQGSNQFDKRKDKASE